MTYQIIRAQLQVLTGMNRHHGYTLGIREGSAEAVRRGITHTTGGVYDDLEAMDSA